MAGIRSLALSALLAATGVLTQADAAAFQFGVCIHLGHNQNSAAATQIGVNAFNTFRDEVSWQRIEAQRGVLSFPDSLKDLDALVSSAAAQGRRPLLILDYGNSQYGGGLVITPDQIAGYLNYVRFVVRHFRGRVDQFEVWNEWNIGLGATGTPRPRGDAARYVALLRATYPAIKAENPGAVVIGGAVSGTDDSWIAAFGQAGGFAYLDAFSVHPYVYFGIGPRPAAPAGLTIVAAARALLGMIARASADARAVYPHGTPERALSWLDSLKVRVDEFAPGRDLGLYVTEIGWPTHEGANSVSESTAAAYAQRFMLLASTRRWLKGVWWYELFDDGTDNHNKEGRFGLLHQNGTPKPAYTALSTVSGILQSPYPNLLSTGAGGEWVLSGRLADGHRYVVAWLPTDDFARSRDWPEGAALQRAGYKVAQGDLNFAAPRLAAAPTLLVLQ